MAEDGASEEEEESGGIEDTLNILTIEAEGTEEEAVEKLEAVLEMEVQENDKGEEEGDATQRAMGALEFHTQDSEPSGATLLYAHNGFNDLSRLSKLWTVQHRWPAGARFTFNCYRHWAQLILRHPGDPPVIIVS